MISASPIEEVALSPCCQRIVILCFFQLAALRKTSSNTRSKIGANNRGAPKEVTANRSEGRDIAPQASECPHPCEPLKVGRYGRAVINLV